ncbi:hypothetical protein C0431_12955 [bacterium]|nr:hypothetical protein [bacterium]
MSDFFRRIRITARDAWSDGFYTITQFHHVVEFFVIWAVNLFIALVVAPIVLILILVLLPIYWLMLLFGKPVPPREQDVVSYRMKEQYQTEKQEEHLL